MTPLTCDLLAVQETCPVLGREVLSFCLYQVIWIDYVLFCDELERVVQEQEIHPVAGAIVPPSAVGWSKAERRISQDSRYIKTTPHDLVFRRVLSRLP